MKCYIQQNPNFLSLLFKETEIGLKNQAKGEKQLLVQVTGTFNKRRLWEIRMPLYIYITVISLSVKYWCSTLASGLLAVYFYLKIQQGLWGKTLKLKEEWMERDMGMSHLIPHLAIPPFCICNGYALI